MGFYKIGDEVEMTQAALDTGLDRGIGKYKPTRSGVVVGELYGNCIRVLRDGRKTAHRYHAKFWKLKTPNVQSKGLADW